MEKKFIQTQDVYKNNEYKNMPSIGRWGDAEVLTTKNKVNVDWSVVDEIVKKYDLEYCLINDTFCCYGERGVYETHFVLYYKTRIDNDWFERKMKAQEYGAYREKMEEYDFIPLLIHDCVHELDEQTPLEFNTAWSGNCGLFGSDDVKRQSYIGGDYLYDWYHITDKWSPAIHDTKRVLKKGVYLLVETSYLKKDGVE